MARTVRSQLFKSFLIQSTLAWMRESGLTPYVEVLKNARHVELPSFVKSVDGVVLLSLGTKATKHLVVSETELGFVGLFGGRDHRVYIPFESILRITTREDVSIVVDLETSMQSYTQSDSFRETKVPHLRLVK